MVLDVDQKGFGTISMNELLQWPGSTLWTDALLSFRTRFSVKLNAKSS